VASSYASEIIVNIQGDEPLLDHEGVRELLDHFGEEREAVVGTLKYPIRNLRDLMDENTVKVVTDLRGYALYFSRSPIPHVMDSPSLFSIDSPDVV